MSSRRDGELLSPNIQTSRREITIKSRPAIVNRTSSKIYFITALGLSRATLRVSPRASSLPTPQPLIVSPNRISLRWQQPHNIKKKTNMAKFICESFQKSYANRDIYRRKLRRGNFPAVTLPVIIPETRYNKLIS